jgi:hypothetical protein
MEQLSDVIIIAATGDELSGNKEFTMVKPLEANLHRL